MDYETGRNGQNIVDTARLAKCQNVKMQGEKYKRLYWALKK